MNPNSNPPTPALRTWVIARLLAGRSFVQKLDRLRIADRELAERLLGAPDRSACWREYLETLEPDAAAAEINAIVAVDPNSPPPPDEWEEPILDDLTQAVRFPLDVFPPALSAMLRRAAECLCCPVDFLAVSALTVAGAAIGRSATMRLKSTWHEDPSLFTAIVGQPGVTKSPSLSLMTRPLWKLTTELLEQHKQSLAMHAELLEQHETDKKAAKANKTAPPVAPPPGPIAPSRVAVNDSTCEALATLLQQNPRGLIIVRDELTSWVTSLNQYKTGGKGSDRQFYLSAWSGTAVAVDRKNQEDRVPIFVPNPFLSVLGGMQPDMLAELVDSRGRNDGFLDRILFSYPDPVRIRWTDQSIDARDLEDWDQAIRWLWSRPSTCDEDGRTKPLPADFDETARARWIHWFDAHCAEAEAETFPASLVGVWSKLRAYAGRFALILTRLQHAYERDPDHPSDEIIVRDWAVVGAIALTDYFKAHASRVRAVLRGGNGLENADARAIVRWLAKTGRDEFTERECRQNFQGRFPLDGPNLREALMWLQQRHCVRPTDAAPKQSKAGGRPGSPAYEVNPALLQRAASRTSRTYETPPKPV